MRLLLYLQVPHFVLGGIGYEFYIGALTLLEINGAGDFLVKPGGGAGFQMTFDASAQWAVSVNFAPFVFLAWLGRVERALFHLADVRAGLAKGDC
ncbi:MAG: hypothetical protein FJ091_03570 [Deltaproteobacteria bacterium]|nr:hypothetical protein [Deltaproteobacteria bacterium]